MKVPPAKNAAPSTAAQLADQQADQARRDELNGGPGAAGGPIHGEDDDNTGH
jgi:hypothetical protein